MLLADLKKCILHGRYHQKIHYLFIIYINFFEKFFLLGKKLRKLFQYVENLQLIGIVIVKIAVCLCNPCLL
jgi:hypothetical protein